MSCGARLGDGVAKLEELDVDEDDWARELGSKIARIESEETIIVVLGEKRERKRKKEGPYNGK